MPHEKFLKNVIAGLEVNVELQALFLGGSLGQGSADQFSDIDLVALAEKPYHEDVASLWRTTLESFQNIVFWNKQTKDGMLLNAITEDWLRCDFYLIEPSSFKGRAKTTVKPLIDRLGVYEKLPDSLPPSVPNANRISYLINEFIRVLGLLPVALGRREYVTAVKGVDVLRDLLTDMMVEECPLADRGGILHLSRLISVDQMKILEGLSYPDPIKDQIIDANLKLAKAFFPLARRLAEELNIVWPQEFEDATRIHLNNALCVDFFRT